MRALIVNSYICQKKTCTSVTDYILLFLSYFTLTKLINELLYNSLNIYLYFIALLRNLITSLEVIFKVTPNLFCIMATMPRVCLLYRLDIWQLGLASSTAFLNVSIISSYVAISNSIIRIIL